MTFAPKSIPPPPAPDLPEIPPELGVLENSRCYRSGMNILLGVELNILQSFRRYI